MVVISCNVLCGVVVVVVVVVVVCVCACACVCVCVCAVWGGGAVCTFSTWEVEAFCYIIDQMHLVESVDPLRV